MNVPLTILDNVTKNDVDPSSLLTKDGDFLIKACFDELELEEPGDEKLAEISNRHSWAVIGLQAIFIKEQRAALLRAKNIIISLLLALVLITGCLVLSVVYK